MKRRGARVLVAALSFAVLSLAILLWSMRGGGGRVQNPGLRLELVGFTNVQGAWCADLVVTNPTRNLQFVETRNSKAKCQGEAIGKGKTNHLNDLYYLENVDNVSLVIVTPNVGVPAVGVVSLRVKLPPETERWRVTTKCFRSDLFSRSYFDERPNRQWLMNAMEKLPRSLAGRLIQTFIEPTWRRSFDLSSGFLTNLPPVR